MCFPSAVLTLVAGALPAPTTQEPLGFAGDVEVASAHHAAASGAPHHAGTPCAVIGPQHGRADHTWFVQDGTLGAAHGCGAGRAVQGHPSPLHGLRGVTLNSAPLRPRLPYCHAPPRARPFLNPSAWFLPPSCWSRTAPWGLLRFFCELDPSSSSTGGLSCPSGLPSGQWAELVYGEGSHGLINNRPPPQQVPRDLSS